jgi:cytoskeletal protein CcmA (bactofilin family)
MSIFRRENVAASSVVSGGSPEPVGPSQKRRITHVAAGTRLRGEVSGATELLIEGEIEGEIRVDSTVTIGAEGSVNGPIAAPVVRVSGSVVGNVTASDRVEVAPSGSVEGDIAAPRVVIAEGAFFKGRVEMKGEGARAARRPRGAAEAAPKPTEAPKPAGNPGS